MKLNKGGTARIKFDIHTGEYELVIEPEANNCFSINFQLNVMSISRKSCGIFSQLTPLFTPCRKHEVRKQQSKFFVKYEHVTS